MAITYDIAILGGTPAGFAAAHWLARKGRCVAVVDAPRRDAESPLCDWVPGDFFRTAGLPTGLIEKCHARPFKRVGYHNLDLTQRVEHTGRKVAGYLLQQARLSDALKAAAVAAGAKLYVTRTSPVIRLEEDCVQILGRRRLAARLLLVTHGTPSEVTSDLSLPAQSVRQQPLVVAALEVPLSRSVPAERFHNELHLLELRERTEIGMFFAFAGLMHLRIISFSRASGKRAAELSAMVANLQRAELVPANLPLGRARGAVWHPPAGIAAETEAHVAKRCLLTGTAGGFVDSVTGQTLAPSVRSALVAAETAISALKSDNPQVALVGYKAAWRKELGEYLRPPSTSLQMLLPLLFVNNRLVERFTASLLYGKSI